LKKYPVGASEIIIIITTTINPKKKKKKQYFLQLFKFKKLPKFRFSKGFGFGGG